MSQLEVASNTTSSHLVLLKKMISSSMRGVTIVSPFLANDISALLAEFDFTHVKQVDLITTFKPNDPEQLTKPYTLRGVLEFFQSQWPSIVLKIHVDNALHGKVYVTTGGIQDEMLVTSANFTKNGLENNHEWGLKTTDIATIDKIIQEIFDAIDYPEVTEKQIYKSCMFADQYAKMHPKWTEVPFIVADILENVYSVDNSENSRPQYFLKPVGTKDEPVTIEAKNDCSDLHQKLRFSKKKPKGVKKGDIVITTAIGPGSILSYFKVTGTAEHVTNQEVVQTPWLERWPWYMEGRNQSQKFGSSWWRHNIRRQDVVTEFLQKYPGIPVTHAGSFGLHTLNMGNDKVRLTKEFGEFLIYKICEAEPANG